jgi:plastocyanin
VRPRANETGVLFRLARLAGLWALPWLAGLAPAADAASLAVSVKRPDGRPLAGAVVLVHGPAQAPEPRSFVVDQLDLMFTPDLTIVPVGSAVRFPNSDKVSHQVYSFSPAKRFQLPLYRGTPYAPTVFEQAGVITLGCNIHDDMIAYLVVTDAGWSGRTDADGNWQAAGLPAGEFRVEIWHPRLREKSDMLAQTLSLDATQAGEVEISLTRALKPEPLGRRPKSWSDY